MPLTSGEKLGAYEVLSPLGSGGMGEVYRARDTKLHREVAIKLLSEKLAPNPERLTRFEREAHLLASLNHPNIATIHGLEEADGEIFLVLELVEGETLAERIARGPIPLEQTLSLFDQIAQGLEAAHEKGIVHRDLKPANIKITPEGRVKILDFGLGKVFEEADAGQVDLSQSPTITRGATREGVILGTAAYMSPEQARSGAVDKRTDIWAFGCCLYEALTGEPAFSGKSVVDILASVVKTEPDWDRLPDDTPFLVRRVLKRCLEKEPRRRLRDIVDARIDLQEAVGAVPGDEMVPATRVSNRKAPVALALALFALGTLLLWSSSGTSPTPPVVRVEIETGPLNTFNHSIAVSPDGSTIAYMDADGQAHIRYLDSDATVSLPRSERGNKPVFSPDGQWVAYASGGKLKKTLVSGGTATTLADWTQGTSFGLDWEGNEIYFADSDGIYRVPANGGERQRLEVTEPESERVMEFPRRPDVLPGGKAILLTVGDFPQGYATAVHEVDTGKRWVLLENAVHASYAPTGHLVFVRDDTLHAVPFDADSLTVRGAPVPVLEDIHITLTNGAVHYAFSDTGLLAYLPSRTEGFRRKLVWVDRGGNVETIRSFPRRIAGPQILPDGERIALTIFDGTRPEVWITELSRETLTPLAPGEWNADASWSPDGQKIVFSGQTEDGRTLFLESLDSGKRDVLARGFNPHWSPDGTTVAYQSFEPGTGHDIEMISANDERVATPLEPGPYFEYSPVFSPDGRWLAYVSNESGDFRVYVRSLGHSQQKHQVSTEWSLGPLWSPDGTELFYRTRPSVMAVDIQTEPIFKASLPRAIFPDPYLGHDLANYFPGYDISPDGERFLMVLDEEEPPFPTEIKLVLNWFEELKRLVPVE